MDKLTKHILNKIRKSEDQSVHFQGIDEPFSDIAPSGAVSASLKYLSEHNYITIINENSYISEIKVSYRAIHPARYLMKKASSYLLNNWIAITALIISIIALLKQ